MTPYLLVFFILSGDYPAQVVQPKVIGMYESVEKCGFAARSEIDKAVAAGLKIENITGACVSSGVKINEL